MDDQKRVGLKGSSLRANISSSLYQIVFVQQLKSWKKMPFFVPPWNGTCQPRATKEANVFDGGSSVTVITTLMSLSPSQGHQEIFASPLLSVSWQSSSPSHSLWLQVIWGWVLNVLWGTDEFVPTAFHSGRPKQPGGRWILTFQNITHVNRL